jgi:hypothetical protein
VNDVLKLSGAKPWIKIPDKAAQALLDSYDIINKHGAWPTRLTEFSTLDEVKDFIRDTVFAIPNDDVPYVRSALAKKVWEDPKVRELFPELRLGNLGAVKDLTADGQKAFAKKVQGFIFKHVTGIGVTKAQLLDMAAVAQEFSASP